MAYSNSHDVTFYVLEESAHCHDFAGTRRLLWDRMQAWMVGLPARN